MELNPAVWFRDGRQYLLDVRSEFRKITWPGRKEYMGGTIGVVFIVVFLTAVLGLIDLGLSEVLELVLG